MNTRQKVRRQDAVFPPVRMYAEELEWAKRQAEMAGLRVSEWGRQRLLDGYAPGESEAIPPEPDREEPVFDARPLASEVRVPLPKPKGKKHVRRS